MYVCHSVTSVPLNLGAKYMHTYIHTYMYTYIHAHNTTHTYISTDRLACITYLPSYIFAHMLAYILTYLFTYIHTCSTLSTLLTMTASWKQANWKVAAWMQTQWSKKRDPVSALCVVHEVHSYFALLASCCNGFVGQATNRRVMQTPCLVCK